MTCRQRASLAGVLWTAVTCGAVDLVWEPTDTSTWCQGLAKTGPFGKAGYVVPPERTAVPAVSTGGVCQRLVGSELPYSRPDWVDIAQGKLTSGQSTCDSSACSGSVELSLGDASALSFVWRAGEHSRFVLSPPITKVRLFFELDAAGCSGSAVRTNSSQPTALASCEPSLPQGWFLESPGDAFVSVGDSKLVFSMALNTYRQGVQASVDLFKIRCAMTPSALPTGCGARQTFSYELRDSLQAVADLPRLDDKIDSSAFNVSECTGQLCTCALEDDLECSGCGLHCDRQLHTVLEQQPGLVMLHPAIEDSVSSPSKGISIVTDAVAEDPCKTFTSSYNTSSPPSCVEVPPCTYDAASAECKFDPAPIISVQQGGAARVDVADGGSADIMVGVNNSIVLRMPAWEGRPTDTFGKVKRVIFTKAVGADPPDPSVLDIGNRTLSCPGLSGPLWECTPYMLNEPGDVRIKVRAQVEAKQLGGQVLATVLTDVTSARFVLSSPPPPTASPTSTPSVSPTAQPSTPETPAPPQTPAPTLDDGELDPCSPIDRSDCHYPCKWSDDSRTCFLPPDLDAAPEIGTEPQRTAAAARKPLGGWFTALPVSWSSPATTCPGYTCSAPCPLEIRVRGCLQADRASEMVPPRSSPEGASCMQTPCECENVAEDRWAVVGPGEALVVSSVKVDRSDVDAVNVTAVATVRFSIGNTTVTRKTRLTGAWQWFWLMKHSPKIEEATATEGGIGLQVVFILAIVATSVGIIALGLWWVMRKKGVGKMDPMLRAADDDDDAEMYGRSVSMGAIRSQPEQLDAPT